MKRIRSLLKRLWFLNFLRRLLMASRYYNRRYLQIFKWGFRSREDTNFTYDLTADNMNYLAHTIAVVTKTDHEEVMKYLEEARTDETLKKNGSGGH